MKKDLFFVDVTLKDLMNLGERAKDILKLRMLFTLLEKYWYGDKEKDLDRWNRIRIGSIWIYLDKNNALHLDFVTRFAFENSPEFLKILEYFKE